LEQDVVRYNKTGPHEPLVALYPSGGTYDADHPYLILRDPPWAHGTGAAAAASAFLAYLRGAAARDAFLAAGFRDASGVGGAALSPANGVTPAAPAAARTAPAPTAVQQTLTAWTAVTRETNMLLVLDVSGSMRDVVTGISTRLDLAKAAAIAAVGKFDSQARLGLWAFASPHGVTTPYQVIVPLGPLGDTMPDGKSRQQDMSAKIGTLTAGGNTGLYVTAAAAQAEVASHFQANATNLVVLLTDGKESTGAPIAPLLTALARNHSSKTPVPVVTIGIGANADFDALAQISRLSGTRSLRATGDVDIDQVLLAGMFGTP
jgi:Ca-activated chloride channel family protein